MIADVIKNNFYGYTNVIGHTKISIWRKCLSHRDYYTDFANVSVNTTQLEFIEDIYFLKCYNEQGEGNPTVGFCSAAKGFMGNFILESNEPLDPKYLFKGQIEINFNNKRSGLSQNTA